MDAVKQFFTLVLLAILALLTSSEVQLDGVARGRAVGGAHLDLGGRRLAVAMVQIRPNRFYYRAVCATI